ncbi:MAG: hypothetical protein P8J37_24690 [Fuerstiella sp.]|nr:hypothetical protein [Fuerstiella sp.]
MNVLAIPLLLFVAWRTLRLTAITRATTAAGAWLWAVAATLTCLAAAVCQLDALSFTDRVVSVVQYLSAVLLLTPLIHILGARRPGITAWPWFVVLPLIIVLQWPAASELLGDNSDTAIRIPSPTVIGYLLMLLMGSGNYFGTACTSSMLFGASGATLILLPVTEWATFSDGRFFLLGTTMLAISAALLPRHFFRQDAANMTPDQLWSDFRDLYGIVWAKRVMDRVNQFAVREHWDVRMTLDGFQAVPAEPERHAGPVCESQAEDRSAEFSEAAPTARSWQVLCWVLHRFVEPEFLRRYLTDSVELQDGPVN